MTRLLEIACFSFESALIAARAGADRIELCVNYKEGGLTPPFELIEAVKSQVKIPVHVMIRPRPGNFIYSEDELLEMKNAIRFCKEKGVAGIVVGCLTLENKVDVTACTKLIQNSDAITLNFHRAIDECVNLDEATEALIALKFNRILSSGGKSTALAGAKELKRLHEKFGHQIKFMAGGGIRFSNINELLKTTMCEEFHSAAITGNSEMCDPKEITNLKSSLRNF